MLGLPTSEYPFFKLCNQFPCICADLQATYLKWNMHNVLKDRTDCPFAMILTFNSWQANRVVFEEFVRWLVVDQKLQFCPPKPNTEERDILFHILQGLYREDHGDGTWDQQLQVLDFFLSLGYVFPRTFYLGHYNHARLCACLCSSVHARLMDLGLPVAEHWGIKSAAGDAQFIYFLWTTRQNWRRKCVALVGLFRKRRHDLGACVNTDVLKVLIKMVWLHRWDELGFSDSFYLEMPGHVKKMTLE